MLRCLQGPLPNPTLCNIRICPSDDLCTSAQVEQPAFQSTKAEADREFAVVYVHRLVP